MSHVATTWAWEQDLPVTEKLVLVALADYAGEHAETWVGQRRLVTMVGVSDRAVRRNLAALAERGLIRRYRRHRRNGSRTSDLIVLAVPGASPQLADIEGIVGEKIDGDSVAPGHERPGGHADASVRTTRTPASGPEPLEEPLETPVSQSVDADRWVGGVPEEVLADARELLRAKTKVGSRLVSDREMRVAAAALAEFNRQMESSFGLGSWLTQLVGRIRERPSWDEAAHVRLVQSAWRIRWWEKKGQNGRADPRVIYGNAKVFEKVVQDATNEAAALKALDEDMNPTTKVWADGRRWQHLSAREQHNALESVAMGIKPWLARADAVAVASSGNGFTSLLD